MARLTKGSVKDWLAWAYLQELPKLESGWRPGGEIRPRPAGYGNGFDSVSRYGDLLARVDAGDLVNYYGIVPDLTAPGEPDPLALTIADLVGQLDDQDWRLADGWVPRHSSGEPVSFGAHYDGAMKRALDLANRRKVSMLVKGVACGAPAPGGFVGPFKEKPVMENGRPAWFMLSEVGEVGIDGVERFRSVEVDGWSKRGMRPYKGAYTKTRLVPDPVGDVAACIESVRLAASLHMLEEWLQPYVGSDRLIGQNSNRAGVLREAA